MQSFTPELRQAAGEGAPEKGALVAQVQSRSPADQAGIQVGDVIFRVDGRQTADSREIQRGVLEREVGADVQLGVWRDGTEVDLVVRTSELPTETALDAPRGGRAQRLGLELETLSAEMAMRLGVDCETRGVLVTAVHPDSAAAAAGLREGDVIVAVDRTPVSTAVGADTLLGKDRRGGHLLRVQRGDATLFVAIPEE